MFTPDIEDQAERLRASLDSAQLNYVLYRIPAVHRSISPRGAEDLAFCKPNLIHHVMTEMDRPVLYLDADVVVREFPERIKEIAAGEADLAIYNGAADPATDAYRPVTISLRGQLVHDRFYEFSHGVDLHDEDQLLCSGVTQFYRNSERARRLLRSWFSAIEQYPGVSDDELLDYAFNFQSDAQRVRAEWLDKDYCRYSWWIHVRPVVDHPSLPAPALPSRAFANVTGRERVDLSRMKRLPAQGPFPRNFLIDTEDKCLLQVVGNQFLMVGTINADLWLSPS